jgi:MFS family permease
MVQPVRLHSTWGVLAVLIFSSLIAGLGFSMGTLLVNAVLATHGYNEFLIGVHTGLASLATAIAAPMVPMIARRFGYVWPIIIASLAMALLYALMPTFPTFKLLFAARFLFGLLLSVPWVLLEAWVNQVSPDKHRGKVTSAYGAFLMLGYGLGPVLLKFVGIDGDLPYYALAVTIALATAPLFLLVPHDPIELVDSETDRPVVEQRDFTVMTEAPFLFAAAFLGGFFMVAYFGLTGIYADRLGYSVSQGNELLALLIIGGLFLQLPIGWLADQLGARQMIYVSLALAGALSLFIPFLDYQSWQLALAIVYAALLQSLFTLPLALLGARFTIERLAAANAIFVVSFEVGSVSGAPLLGAAMQNIHHNALPFGTAMLLFGLLAFQGYRRMMLRP